MCAGPSVAHLGPDELVIKLKKWREAKPGNSLDDDQSINDNACNARCNDLKIRTLERDRRPPYPGGVGQFPNPARDRFQIQQRPGSNRSSITLLLPNLSK